MTNQKGYIHIIVITIILAIIFSLLFLFPKTKEAIRTGMESIVQNAPAAKNKINAADSRLSNSIKQITGKINALGK